MGKGVVKLGEGNWAVKDGNLLAAKETNGRFKNAEFTVTRGTDATYVGRDGLIKRFLTGNETELVTDGGFENGLSDWDSDSNVTIVNGAARFNNIGLSGANAYLNKNNILEPGKRYKFECDVISTNGKDLVLEKANPSNTSIGATTTGHKTIYFTQDTQTHLTIKRIDAETDVTIDNISVVDVSSIDDTPRIDFTDNTDGHLLLEPESRNLIDYSEDFRSNSNYTTTAPSNIFESGYLAPDGSLTATRINGFDGYYVALSGTETGDSKSMYVKSGNGQTGNVNLLDINEQAHSLFEVTNEWKRVELVGNDSWFYIVDGRGASLTLNDIIVWGLQQEDLPYATSYIPTNGGQVTRDAETCTGAGEAIDFNSEEGVLYAEIAAFEAQPDFFISMNDGTQNNRVIIKFSEAIDNQLTAFTINSTNSSSITHTISDFKQYNKIALSYNSSYLKLFVNGQEVGTSVASPNLAVGLNVLNLSNLLTDKNVKGKVKAIRVYKETDGIDLATLTSL